MFTHSYTPDDIANGKAYKTGMRRSGAAAVDRHFASVPLFAECSKRELRLLTRSAVVEPRATGATLLTEGQVGGHAYVILQGRCRVVRKGRRVGQVEAGGVVGELSMINRAPGTHR